MELLKEVLVKSLEGYSYHNTAWYKMINLLATLTF